MTGIDRRNLVLAAAGLPLVFPGRLSAAAPRGGLVTFWSATAGRYLADLAVADGCGLAPAPGAGRFLISSGLGRLLRYDVAAAAAVMLRGDGAPAWDNHLQAL